MVHGLVVHGQKTWVWGCHLPHCLERVRSVGCCGPFSRRIGSVGSGGLWSRGLDRGGQMVQEAKSKVDPHVRCIRCEGRGPFYLCVLIGGWQSVHYQLLTGAMNSQKYIYKTKAAQKD